jgi:hypothetical protein
LALFLADFFAPLEEDFFALEEPPFFAVVRLADLLEDFLPLAAGPPFRAAFFVPDFRAPVLLTAFAGFDFFLPAADFLLAPELLVAVRDDLAAEPFPALFFFAAGAADFDAREDSELDGSELCEAAEVAGLAGAVAGVALSVVAEGRFMAPLPRLGRTGWRPISSSSSSSIAVSVADPSSSSSSESSVLSHKSFEASLCVIHPPSSSSSPS